MRNAILIGLAGILLLAGATAQEPTFRSESNVVMVPTLVRDRNRDIVYDLKADDFVIEDDGVPQAVQLDEGALFRPASVVVAVQIGRRADYELPRIRGLKSMLYPLLDQGHAEIAIVAFDSHVHELQNFSGDDVKTSRVLDSLQPGDGGAAIIDAVDYGLRMLASTPTDRQRVLLLVSETRDHGSKKKPVDLLRELGSSNAVVYALTFSPSKSNVLDTLRGTNNPDLHPEQSEVHEGPDLLAPLVLLAQGARKNAAKTITGMTGGEYANFSTGKNFDRDMTEFTNHLYARYLLSFAPSSPHPGLHHITVRLKQPGKAEVMARSSYWAASPNSSAPTQ
ncbi:MAG TPA: VWA domain-containing protein [Candidatus Koribacter sp.]|jgi:VWFA-related protein